MSNTVIAKKIENYARENMAEGQKAFGEFMYHAELIRRGHWDIHYQDLEDMALENQQIIKSLCGDVEEDSIFSKIDKDLAEYL